jgi:hypothetical protein
MRDFDLAAVRLDVSTSVESFDLCTVGSRATKTFQGKRTFNFSVSFLRPRTEWKNIEAGKESEENLQVFFGLIKELGFYIHSRTEEYHTDGTIVVNIDGEIIGVKN